MQLAGRTTDDGERPFDTVIFESDDETAAREPMESDPAIAEGVMTGELHTYRVDLRHSPDQGID